MRTTSLVLASLVVALSTGCGTGTDASNSLQVGKVYTTSVMPDPTGIPPVPAICEDLASQPTIDGIITGPDPLSVRYGHVGLSGVPAFQTCRLSTSESPADQVSGSEAHVAVASLPHTTEQFDAMTAAMTAELSGPPGFAVDGIGDAAFFDGDFRLYVLMGETLVRIYANADPPLEPGTLPPIFVDLAELVVPMMPSYGRPDNPGAAPECAAADDAVRAALGAEPDVIWAGHVDKGISCYWGTREAAVSVTPAAGDLSVDVASRMLDDAERVDVADQAVYRRGQPERVWFDVGDTPFELVQFSVGSASAHSTRPLPLDDVVPIIAAFAAG